MTYLLKVFLCSSVFLIYSGVIHAAVVIQYHHVDTVTPAATSISPDVFAEHMTYLADNGFAVWPLPRLLHSLKSGEVLPDKVIAITFDDGYKSVYTHAVPLLHKHHFPFSVFINTKLVGRSGYMSWGELSELVRQGNTVANHTASHPHLVRLLDKESESHWHARITQEMTEAEKVLRNKLGQTPGLLAYPYGEYDQRVEAIARELGLLAFAQHSGAFDQHVDWQAIPRFAFGGQYTALKRFIEKVNSLPMPLSEAFVSDDSGQRLVDPLLPQHATRPTLTLRLQTARLAQAINCYASGQGRIAVEVNGRTITTRPTHDLPVGRSRINCTASSEQRGRFYWYSAFFMRKQADGQWYAEP